MTKRKINHPPKKNIKSKKFLTPENPMFCGFFAPLAKNNKKIILCLLDKRLLSVIFMSVKQRQADGPQAKAKKKKGQKMELILLSAVTAIDPKTKENDSGLSEAELAAIHGACKYARGEAVSLYDCAHCEHRGACPVAAMSIKGRAAAKAAKAARRAAEETMKAAAN